MVEVNVTKLCDMYAALGNEYRLKIVLLCSEKPRTISEISQAIGVSYNLTSTHVTRLARAGLLKKTKNPDKTVTTEALVKISPKGEIVFK